jgi:hypothetical protein
MSGGAQETGMSGKPEKKTKDELDKELEEGLKGTFPASDPPAVTQPGHREPARRKH